MCNEEEIFDFWIFLDPGIHLISFMLKILTIFVDTGTPITVHRIHLKFGILMQNNMYMCNEEENFDFLEFSGFQASLKILTIFVYIGLKNGSLDSFEIWYIDAEWHIDVQRKKKFWFPGISWIALIDLKTRIRIQPGIAIGTSQVSEFREL